MLKIGLTGGIGSGKSTVAAIFEVLGVPVYYADVEAKKLMREDEEIKQSIKLLLGEESYVDGELNRAFISSSIFNNEDKRIALNNIVHPKTIEGAERWMMQQDAPYAIKEAALIFESHSENHLDYIIGVTAPESIRIERVMRRDNISKEKVMTMILGQMNENEKMDHCNFVIQNNETELLIPQVISLHEFLLEMD
jgi:dephospho-CoA kinase